MYTRAICSMLVALVAPRVYTPGQVTNLNTGFSYGSLGAAIGSANAGDTLEIDDTGYTSSSPLVFTENLVISGDLDGLTIKTKSDAYPPQVEVNGSLSGSVIRFVPGTSQPVTSATLVQGIKLTNGSGTTVGARLVGGGVSCESGSGPTLRNCVITKNHADDGGGIYVGQITGSSGPRIMRDSITKNTASLNGGGIFVENLDGDYAGVSLFSRCRIATNTAGYSGGGLFAGNGTSPSMTHSWVDENEAQTLDGGGVCLLGTVAASFDSSMLRDNQALNGLGGGLAVLFADGTIVRHTTVSSNTSGSSGGGIHDDAASASTFEDDLFTSNESTGGFGGGLMANGADPAVDYCTFTLNKALRGGGIASRGMSLGRSILWADSQTLTAGTAWEHELYTLSGTTAVDECDVQGSAGAVGTNGIDQNPLFTTGTTGPCSHAVLDTVHLDPSSSPCVDFSGGSLPTTMTGRSTDPDHAIPDTGSPDLGFHYPGFGCP